jgi:hypothetical protein
MCESLDYFNDPKYPDRVLDGTFRTVPSKSCRREKELEEGDVSVFVSKFRNNINTKISF